MSGCEIGVFEYEFVYIQWVATSLGGVVGFLGGLFVGIILLGVAVVVHQLHLAKKQRSSSLKEQVRQRHWHQCNVGSNQGPGWFIVTGRNY